MDQGIRRLRLRLLIDAIEVLQGTACIKGPRWEHDRTITTAWFFSPERYSADDPCSFENVCWALGMPASSIRRVLRTGKKICTFRLAQAMEL